MRFQTFDVLLFPRNPLLERKEDVQTPLQEFRTACFAQQEPYSVTASTTPMLTCFVPSLPEHSPFQVSLHAWDLPQILGPGGEGRYVLGTTYAWQLRVLSDGKVIGGHIWGEDGKWPVVVDTSLTNIDANGKALPLEFPGFHRHLMSQSHWNACDEIGRVKVELSAGYTIANQLDGKLHFVKNLTHVVFSFQPAPLDVLERSGIAWPNPTMPIVRASSKEGLPTQEECNSSRSTSAYTSMSLSNYLPFDRTMPYYSEATAQLFPPPSSNSKPPGHLEVRLSSDQLQKITEAYRDAAAAISMPPPPVPQRNAPAPIVPYSDRRGDSRFSDISMHAGCESYPTCLSEDAEGHTVHSPGVPAASIKSRKEGSSSPIKPQRDFLSTVLADDTKDVLPEMPSLLSSSPATVSSGSKKRTRSALRSLKLNDGSPEKREVPSKPVRKASRVNSSTSATSDKENMMVE